MDISGNQDRCQTCDFWHRTSDDGDAGECRVAAPIISENGENWPTTMATNCCAIHSGIITRKSGLNWQSVKENLPEKLALDVPLGLLGAAAYDLFTDRPDSASATGYDLFARTSAEYDRWQDICVGHVSIDETTYSELRGRIEKELPEPYRQAIHHEIGYLLMCRLKGGIRRILKDRASFTPQFTGHPRPYKYFSVIVTEDVETRYLHAMCKHYDATMSEVMQAIYTFDTSNVFYD